MAIPTYLQEINDFGSPDGHPNEVDFIAEGLERAHHGTLDMERSRAERHQ